MQWVCSGLSCCFNPVKVTVFFLLLSKTWFATLSCWSVTPRQTSIPPRGKYKYSLSLHAILKPGTNAGVMGHLARTQILPVLPLPFLFTFRLFLLLHPSSSSGQQTNSPVAWMSQQWYPDGHCGASSSHPQTKSRIWPSQCTPGVSVRNIIGEN